jgi:protein involved in polysaccharide export with SLBB domain
VDPRLAGSGLEQLMRAKSSAIPVGDQFFEGPVDPDEYIVGPGDRLGIVFWQPTFTENTISVNGDGDVIIPYVGVVPVAGLTLREARRQIEEAVAKNLRIAKVTISLIQPRQLRINVTGLVESPGTFILPATARISDAIAQAGGIKRKTAYSSGDTASVTIGSQRTIELLDKTGQIAGRADLLLFYSGGRLSANPHLKDGWTIHVPYVDEGQNEVGVIGAVHQSGTFEFAPGDRVENLLVLGGGLTSTADSSNLLLMDRDGHQVIIDLRADDAAQRLNGPVGPGARLYVYGKPQTSQQGSVQVQGEVNRPGGYPVLNGKTTLREVLQAAGGLLPTAVPNSARLVRNVKHDVLAPERDRILAASLAAMPKGSYYWTDAGIAVEFSRWNYSTVVVDVTNAATDGNAAGDITLQDGDVLEVPRSPLGVRVLGGVNQAGEVAWQPDQDLSYYLSKAGGLNKAGWKSRAVILKARNGSQLRYEPSLPIDPGDLIFIPAKPEQTTWEQIKDFVAVTTQVATIALVIQNIRK